MGESMERLSGRVAIVTGGGRGIGYAIAQRLVAEGAHVVVADIDGEAAYGAARELSQSGREALGLPLDVAQTRDLPAFMQRVHQWRGRLDILVNNAGIAQRKDVLEVTEEDWDRMMAVNLKGVFFACQQAAAIMATQESRGVIVNLASTSSFVASSIPMVHYDASKAGVRMLTVSLAVHLAHLGIRVNAIAPGTIDTALTRGVVEGGALSEQAASKIPLGRLGHPPDLAGAVAFLSSDDAAYVTGHTLVVDGGWLCL